MAYKIVSATPVTIAGYTGPRPLEAWALGLTVPPTGPAPQPAPLGGLRQRIVNVAKQELVRWGRGTRKETDPAMHDTLRVYWQSLGLSQAKADEKIRRRSAWSAAFISWVMAQAGAGAAFRKSGFHYIYVAAAKRNRVNGDQSNPFWAFRITEVAPQVGDLVCKARKARGAAACSGVTYDNVDSGTSWSTHCDIVTNVRTNAITVIGGNVGQSVKDKTIATDARGFLPERARDGCRFIAVIKVGDSLLQAQPPRTNGGGAISSLPGRLFNMVRTGALKLKVALAMVAGERDVNTLTNMLFFARHPGRNGARIRPDEKELAQEWLDIRDHVITPALQALRW